MFYPACEANKMLEYNPIPSTWVGKDLRGKILLLGRRWDIKG
jgi:hypothetical protein